MDEALQARYSALVAYFEPTNPYEALVKPIVQAAADRYQLILRPDATYFLLVNFVRMILRPYAASIPAPPDPGWPRRRRRSSTLPRFLERCADIEKAADVIMDELSKSSDELSAHQVMLAIHRRWKDLSIFFMWG